MSFSDDIIPNNASSAIITRPGLNTVKTGLEVFPSELYFGALVVGEDQLVRTAKVTNVGRKTLRIKSVVLETTSNQFSMSSGHPTLLKSGESFIIEGKYESNVPGLVVGVIYITTNEEREPYKITLSGRVISSLYLEDFDNEFRALLLQESWARADADSAEAGQRLQLEAAMGENIEAKILAERIARVTALEAEALSREVLTARVDDNYAEINSEKIVRANADEAMASRIDLLEATTGDGLTEPTVRAWIEEEATVRTNADLAEAQARQAMGVSLGEYVDAGIEVERLARATAISAEALARETLSASLNSDIADVDAKIIDERIVRSDADGALALRISTLEATDAGIDYEARAAIVTESTARANADSAIAQQINTVIANYSGPGENLILNSEFITGISPWIISSSTTPVSNLGYAPAFYTPAGGRALMIEHLGTGNGNSAVYADVNYQDPIAVKPNQRYQLSLAYGNYRSVVHTYIQWFTSAGAHISYSFPIFTIPLMEFGAGGSLEAYIRTGAFVKSPPGAATAVITIRKIETSASFTNSVFFFTKPFFAVATEDQTILSPYVAGSGQKALHASVVTTVQATANAQGDLNSMWRVVATAGYKVAGLKLAANGGLTSFDVLADVFRVSLPDGSGSRQIFAAGLINGVYGVAINGNLAVDGSVVIRGPSGAVLFHAGATLQDQIAPYEWAATNGATIGGNLFGQFNAGNIGVYMASAAIGYLQLAGGAVSVSAGANWTVNDVGFNTLFASLTLYLPANGYLSFTGSASSFKRSDLNTTAVKWLQQSNMFVDLFKNNVKIYTGNFGTSFYNGAYLGNTEFASLGGINNSAVAIAGGCQVTAVPGDVFRCEVRGSTSLFNHTTQTTYNVGDNTGFINFVGSYR